MITDAQGYLTVMLSNLKQQKNFYEAADLWRGTLEEVMSLWKTCFPQDGHINLQVFTAFTSHVFKKVSNSPPITGDLTREMAACKTPYEALDIISDLMHLPSYDMQPIPPLEGDVVAWLKRCVKIVKRYYGNDEARLRILTMISSHLGAGRKDEHRKWTRAVKQATRRHQVAEFPRLLQQLEYMSRAQATSGGGYTVAQLTTDRTGDTPPTGTTSTSTRKLPQCFCGERHLYKDCPVLTDPQVKTMLADLREKRQATIA
jgi:hypothetical protein